ncbi:MAG: outer membrane protein assembly factor BamD [Candidatus Schekmanbacteria bacterium]|nr:MAG: outer membrane protein assembly factor BamD [Candidatus Schekmanbacteria bacterium]
MKALNRNISVKLALLFFLFPIVFSLGCYAPPVTNNLSAMELFAYGKKLVDKGDYKDAVDVYKKIKFNFPDSIKVSRARLFAANGYYADEKYEEAIAEYKEFTKYHPAHLEVPFAYYRIGMSNFYQILPSQLDQTKTKEALENFNIIRERYPESIYYDIAGERISFCKRRLAEHSYGIGRFYYKMRMYRPAIKRLKRFIRDCEIPDLKIRAMGILAESLWKDEENERALMLYKEIALIYKNTAYGKRALQMLKRYGADYEIEVPSSLQ